jgi:hypothetical protein
MPEVLCPNCSRRLKAPEEAVGKEAKCSQCCFSFVVPATPAPAREIILEPVEKGRMTATRITAVAACVIALCVVAQTIEQLAPRPESLEHKRVRYAKVSRRIDRLTKAQQKFTREHLDSPTETPQQKQAFLEAESKELGVTQQEAERLYREKQTLAEELGIPD